MIARTEPDSELRTPSWDPCGPMPKERVEDPLSEGICSLEAYGLGVRQIDQLERSGYVWVGDLVGVVEDDLRSIRYFGAGGINRLRKALAEFLEVQAGK